MKDDNVSNGNDQSLSGYFEGQMCGEENNMLEELIQDIEFDIESKKVLLEKAKMQLQKYKEAFEATKENGDKVDFQSRRKLMDDAFNEMKKYLISEAEKFSIELGIQDSDEFP